jgi:hypothetical protein
MGGDESQQPTEPGVDTAWERQRAVLDFAIQDYQVSMTFFSMFYCALTGGLILLLLGGLGAIAFGEGRGGLARLAEAPLALALGGIGILCLFTIAAWGHYFLSDYACRKSDVALDILGEMEAPPRMVRHIPRYNRGSNIRLIIGMYLAYLVCFVILLAAVLALRLAAL